MTEQNEAIRALQAADKAAWKARWKYVLDETGMRVGRASAVRKAKPKRVRPRHAKPSGTVASLPKRVDQWGIEGVVAQQQLISEQKRQRRARMGK